MMTQEKPEVGFTDLLASDLREGAIHFVTQSFLPVGHPQREVELNFSSGCFGIEFSKNEQATRGLTIQVYRARDMIAQLNKIKITEEIDEYLREFDSGPPHLKLLLLALHNTDMVHYSHTPHKTRLGLTHKEADEMIDRYHKEIMSILQTYNDAIITLIYEDVAQT